MENSAFVHDENILLVHDEAIEWVGYETPITSRIDGIISKTPGTRDKETTSNLWQKLKHDKLAALYWHLIVKDDSDIARKDPFRVTTDKKEAVVLTMVINGIFWKKIGRSLAASSLNRNFADVNVMKSFVGNDETLSVKERSFKAATKLNRELRADIEMENMYLRSLLSLAKDIHTKTREASQNTNLDMREYLGMDKALQAIQGKLTNNAPKLTVVNESTTKNSKK